MDIIGFFKGIGHALARTFGILRKLVPEDWLERAIELAKAAAVQIGENDARREWVIAELMKIPGMTDSTARLLVELAVKHLKADAHDTAAAA